MPVAPIAPDARPGRHFTPPGMSASWGDRHALFTRIVHGPRDRVFRAWTDAAELAKWWGPTSFTNPVSESDARAGGAWRIHMRGPDGIMYPANGTYREVARPERLVMTSNFEMPSPPVQEMLLTVTFEDGERDTLLTVRTDFASIKDRYTIEGMKAAEGWAQSLVKLDALVAA